MSSEALAKSICESAIKKAIGKSHDLKKKNNFMGRNFQKM